MKIQVLARDLIRLSLREDTSQGDPTTAALLDRGRIARALIFTRAEGIICGLNIAQTVFKTIDPRVKFKLLVPEGSRVKADTAIAEVKGKARTLFKGERTVLYFIQHLSGISTLTGRFVKRAKNTSVSAKIIDTRKTTPGWRHLEKYAVKIGGGDNHRMTLGEFILIKDNHWKFLPGGSLSETVRGMRKRKPGMKIEVEVKKISELKKALEAGVDIIMLDNMNYANLKKSIQLIKRWRRLKGKKKPLIEISGGVNFKNIGRLARLGAEQISVGALTHSAPAFPADMQIWRL